MTGSDDFLFSCICLTFRELAIEGSVILLSTLNYHNMPPRSICLHIFAVPLVALAENSFVVLLMSEYVNSSPRTYRRDPLMTDIDDCERKLRALVFAL